MSGLIPRSFINDLVTRVDIVEIISPRIRLKRAGGNYQGLCPFHQEKTPSFSVSQSKQFYYCFGCGAHGNALDFLMNFDKLGFIEAVESLASTIGVEVPREQSSVKDRELLVRQQNCFQVLDKVVTVYRNEFKKSSKAQQYIKKRGLSEDICERFAIGYAPNARGMLSRSIGGAVQKHLLQSGMLLTNDRHDIYERFRDRVMFPIRDRRGKVLAFGGRSFGNEQPKYLNSPETEIFHKGEELYGLYEARQALNKMEQLLVVEGYMDVVGLAQAGVDFAVATMGTAVTARQVQKLLRETKTVIFCFDGDLAGKKAAWRALEIALFYVREGITIKFLFLPEKEDPDSYVGKFGKERFLELIESANSLSQYFFNHLLSGPQATLDTLDGRALVAKNALAFINKMPKGVFYELMLQELGELVKMDSGKIKGLLEEKPRELSKEPIEDKALVRAGEIPKIVYNALNLLLQKPSVAKELRSEQIEILAKIANKYVKLLVKLINLVRQQPNLTIGAILETYRGTAYEDLLAKMASKERLLPEAALEEEFLGSWNRLLERCYEKEIEELLAKSASGSITLDEKRNLQKLLRKSKK